MSGLTIVVLSWNTRDLTLACLEAAGDAAEGFRRACARPAGIVLVDNGSGDDTVAAVRAAHPAVEVVALPRNVGFAAGANAGAARASGEILLFLNSDARLGASTLELAWRHFAAHPGTGVVGPSLRHADGRPQHPAHAFPSLLDECVPAWLIDALRPARRPARRRVGAEPRPVDAVQGAALFVRRGVFEALGGFCEAYFFYLEETDLCWRVRAAGHGVDLVPGAPVVHAAGASSKRVDAAASRIEFHRSLYRFLATRRGPGTARLAAALRTLRGLVTVAALAIASPVSASARRRRRERFALLRWHLAGRPADRGLEGLARRTPDAAVPLGRPVGGGQPAGR